MSNQQIIDSYYQEREEPASELLIDDLEGNEIGFDLTEVGPIYPDDMEVQSVSSEFAKEFLNSYHPLRSGGSLKGAIEILAAFEAGFPVFVAVFTTPRSRWKHFEVTLELSRLAWSPMAKRSATTFLRKCIRILKRNYSGMIVTYALPGSEGIVYSRAGFERNGHSSGCPWSKRGANERPTPNTIGTGQRLPRFFAKLSPRQPNKQMVPNC